MDHVDCVECSYGNCWSWESDCALKCDGMVMKFSCMTCQALWYGDVSSGMDVNVSFVECDNIMDVFTLPPLNKLD